jgi:hypothetical protein
MVHPQMVETDNAGRRRMLQIYLPASQVMIALVLGIWGSNETRNYVGNSLTLDYIAPAECILHVINMPAALLLHAIRPSVIFHIGPEYSKRDFSIYLCFIAVLWLFVGNRFAGPRISFRSRSATAKLLSGVGILCGAIVVVSGVSLLHGPWALFLPFAAFAWGVGLISLSI